MKLMTPYFLLTFFWILFYFSHSFLITDNTKKFMQKRLNSGFKYYRLSYNIFSTITFLLILWYAANLPVIEVFARNPVTNYVGLSLALVGILLGKRAFKPYHTGEFLGLSQIKKNDADLENRNELKTGGLLSKIRHPLYSATILLVVGFWFFSPTLANSITVGSALVYLYIGIQLEEKKLIRHFGKAYLDYKKRVPMLIPKFW